MTQPSGPIRRLYMESARQIVREVEDIEAVVTLLQGLVSDARRIVELED